MSANTCLLARTLPHSVVGCAQHLSWQALHTWGRHTCVCRMEDRMATLVAEADVHKAQLESSAGILGQQQQLEEAARRQVSTHVTILCSC